MIKITQTERLNLITIANVRNDEEVRNMKIEGMDYTLSINLEDLTRRYYKDILTRVRVYGERIAVIVNGTTPKTVEEAYENVFGYNSRVTLRELIDESNVAYYDGILVRDLYNVCK